MSERVCIIRQRDYRELALRREAEALRDAGLDVDVIVLGGEQGGGTDVVDGITVHRLPLGRERGSKVRYLADYLAFFVLAAVTVARLHRRRPFAAVQVNTMPDLLVFCAAYPRWRGAKVVAFMKEPTPELGQLKLGGRLWPRLLARVEQAAIAWADAAITVTEDLKEVEVARGADPDKIHVVLNGPGSGAFADPATLPGPDPDHFTLLCHGAVVDRYGHDTIIRAVGLARHQVPGLRFRFTGEGPEVARLLELVRSLGLEEHVTHVGWVSMDQLSAELAGCDVGVVAQLRSGYSDLVHTNKMFEYFLFDKPVVASRLRSVARYFPDETLAWFEPGDAEGLAEVIVALHRDPDRRARMVASARRRCQDYGWAAQSRRYVDVFRHLGLELRGPAAPAQEEAA